MTIKIPKKEKPTRRSQREIRPTPKFTYNTMGDAAVKQIGVQRQTTKYVLNTQARPFTQSI